MKLTIIGVQRSTFSHSIVSPSRSLIVRVVRLARDRGSWGEMVEVRDQVSSNLVSRAVSAEGSDLVTATVQQAQDSCPPCELASATIQAQFCRTRHPIRTRLSLHAARVATSGA